MPFFFCIIKEKIYLLFPTYIHIYNADLVSVPLSLFLYTDVGLDTNINNHAKLFFTKGIVVYFVAFIIKIENITSKKEE